jgi:hypothetical protein
MGGTLSHEEKAEFPNRAMIRTALLKHFKAVKGKNQKLPTGSHHLVYNVRDAFGTFGYWTDLVRPDRFERTLRSGILYRPHIVDELSAKVESAFASGVRQGIIVQGPHGIGKSHSLINLVLKLESSGNYLVTFVPDCTLWNSAVFLVDLICKSFGLAVYGSNGIGLDEGVYAPDVPLTRLDSILRTISEELTAMNKQWVFVFDQVEKLFVQCPGSTRIEALQYPFPFISLVLRPGRIVSVVSASADNDCEHISTRRFKITATLAK